jgi:hypothetical protein
LSGKDGVEAVLLFGCGAQEAAFLLRLTGCPSASREEGSGNPSIETVRDLRRLLALARAGASPQTAGSEGLRVSQTGSVLHVAAFFSAST